MKLHNKKLFVSYLPDKFQFLRSCDTAKFEIVPIYLLQQNTGILVQLCYDAD